MLFFPVYHAPNLRRLSIPRGETYLPSSAPQPSNLQTFQPANDHASNSLHCTFLATPHPLTPIESHSCKNGRGAVLPPRAPSRSEMGCSQPSNLPTFKPANGFLLSLSTFNCRLSTRTLFSLFTQRAFHNSFPIKRFHTPTENCRVSLSRLHTFLKYYFNCLANSPLILRKSPHFSSVPFIRLRTLSFSVSRKSCICHSYENTGGVPQLFPFWNSALCASDKDARPEPADGGGVEGFFSVAFSPFTAPLSPVPLSLMKSALTKVTQNKQLYLVLESTLMKNTRGWGATSVLPAFRPPDLQTFKRSDLQTFRRSNVQTSRPLDVQSFQRSVACRFPTTVVHFGASYRAMRTHP
jgi:hypothetical protein